MGRTEAEEKPSPRKQKGMMANTGALFASRLVAAALGWSGTILIVRNLSVEDWGKFSLVFSFLTIVAVLSNIVSNRVAIHGLLGEDAERFAGSYLILRILLGLFAYCVAMAFVVLAGYPSVVVQATAVAGTTLLIATPSVAYEAIYQAHLELDRVAIARVIGQVAQFVLTAALAIMGSTLVLFTIPAVLCDIVALILKIRWARPLLRVHFIFDTSRWLAMLREGIPLAIGVGLASLYYSLDMVMLSKLDTFSAVGTYGVAYKFSGVIQFLPAAMAVPLLSILVRHWPDNPSAFSQAVRRAGTALYLAAVLLVVIFALFATPAIGLLYGHQYEGAGNATRLVIAGECVGFFTTLAVITFAAVKRNSVYAIAAGCGLLANFAMNLVLIPPFSYQGSAWATLATELLVVGVLWGRLAPMLECSPVAIDVAMKGALAGAGAAAIGLAADAVMPWLAAALLTAAVYLALVHFARIPDPDGLITFLRDDEPVPDAERPDSIAPAPEGVPDRSARWGIHPGPP